MVLGFQFYLKLSVCVFREPCFAFNFNTAHNSNVNAPGVVFYPFTISFAFFTLIIYPFPISFEGLRVGIFGRAEA